MVERRRSAWVLALALAVVTALGVVGGASSGAQLVDPDLETTTTTSPDGGVEPPVDSDKPPTQPPSGDDPDAPPPGTDPDGAPAEDGEHDEPVEPDPTSTPAPDGASDPPQDPDGTPDRGPVPRVVPSEAQRIIDSVRRTPANSSRALYAAIQDLVALGLDEQEAVRIGFGRFPVAGIAGYSHDWLYPRYGPGFRFHLGTDVFADYGTPLRSPVEGTVSSGVGSLGGLWVKVHMSDGTYFYYAHLSALPDGFVEGMAVRTGDIVGFVGDSGNARGGSPHLHIGIYPQGGSAVDPKPILDQMLADAMAVLPQIVDQVRSQSPATAPAPLNTALRDPDPLLATSLLRDLLDERAGTGVATAVLFEAVGNPSSGGLAVAESEAGRLAASIDWHVAEARARSRRALIARTAELFREALGPLAPPRSDEPRERATG